MLRDDRIAELRREYVRSNVRNDELKEFYALFDKTFLGLFPSFIDEMNGLLDAEACTEMHRDGELTIVLRMYALIRLGIADTATIAALLDCSIRTVYNYRSFVQRHVRPDVGDLEQRVQQIGLNGNSDHSARPVVRTKVPERVVRHLFPADDLFVPVPIVVEFRAPKKTK